MHKLEGTHINTVFQTTKGVLCLAAIYYKNDASTIKKYHIQPSKRNRAFNGSTDMPVHLGHLYKSHYWVRSLTSKGFQRHFFSITGDCVVFHYFKNLAFYQTLY